jgi:2-polyprenyl-6-methoxyphenol hydroxylase-like FAD-dependent oxidoreductase
MGLLDELLEIAISGMGRVEEEGQKESKGEGGFVIWDHEWKQVMKVRNKTPPGCPVAGMRILRGNLRMVLARAVEALPGVEIRWGNAISSVSSSSDGRIEVETSNGEKATGDLLVAADGSSSKIRGILRPNDGLKFAGPTCIYGTTDISHSPNGRGEEFGTIISGKGTALFIAPVDEKSIIWCLSWQVESPHLPQKQPMSLEASEDLMKEARKQGEPVYGQRFVDILNATPPRTLNKFNAMDKPAFPHTGAYITNPELEALNGKVVFLGDANHAVSPFAGNGANLAIMDGWSFAEFLVSSRSLGEAMSKHDKVAVGRAKQVIRMSHFAIRVMHSTGWMLYIFMCFLKVVQMLFFK